MARQGAGRGKPVAEAETLRLDRVDPPRAPEDDDLGPAALRTVLTEFASVAANMSMELLKLREAYARKHGAEALAKVVARSHRPDLKARTKPRRPSPDDFDLAAAARRLSSARPRR